MKSSVASPALVEGRSDEKDNTYLTNDLRRLGVISYRDRFDAATALTAVPRQIWLSDDMPTQSTWEVTVSVVAHCAADNTAAGYQRVARFKRGAGVAALVAAAATPVADVEDVAAWDITLAAIGNGVSLTVTGDATRTVSWSALVEIREAT